MFKLLKLPTFIIGIVSLLFLASPIASAKANNNNNNNGVPADLDQIKALLQQVLTAVAPPPPPVVNNKTRLLFPFVSNTAGFDTGISIANTGADSTGTIGISGTATIYFFPQGGGPVTSVSTGVIPVGGQYVNLASILKPNFQGYIEVVCEFPFAHGWGFLSDLGARNLAATVPALVLPLARTNTGVESLGQ
jgi:hypothetical protein